MVEFQNRIIRIHTEDIREFDERQNREQKGIRNTITHRHDVPGRVHLHKPNQTESFMNDDRFVV